MPHLIEVAFKGNRKEFFLWEADELPPTKAAVIVEADRGEDLGRVHAIGELAAKRSAGVPHGLGAEGAPPARKALRLATADDVKRAGDLGEQNESARRRAMERVKANGLVMKLTDAEWQWDRKKLTFYFTAEKRVDFRNLVRDLASMFRTRIELKQIGVRDEARRLDGIGRCGRQYCSSSWLPELRPVNLGVAKDQRLSLNPTQISGACGRLMCSLRYEHEFYVQSRKRFPKEGKILVTSLGEEKVVANDIFHDRVTLRRPDGDARVVALADLKREVAAAAEGAGEAGALAAAAALTQSAEDVDDSAESSQAAAHGGDEGDLAAAAEGRAAGAPPGAGERRHEPRPEGRRGRVTEQRRPSRGGERAGNGAARGGTVDADGATSDSPAPPLAAPRPPASTAAANAGAWLRQRAPLPQVTDPRGGTQQPPVAPVAATAAVAKVAPAPADGGGVAGKSAAAPTSAEDPPEAATTAAPADETAAADGDELQQRRARRRRGRRGGRRGRGGGAGGGAAGEHAPGDAAGTSDDTDAGDDQDDNDDGGDATRDRATDEKE